MAAPLGGGERIFRGWLQANGEKRTGEGAGAEHTQLEGGVTTSDRNRKRCKALRGQGGGGVMEGGGGNGAGEGGFLLYAPARSC